MYWECGGSALKSERSSHRGKGSLTPQDFSLLSGILRSILTFLYLSFCKSLHSLQLLGNAHQRISSPPNRSAMAEEDLPPRGPASRKISLGVTLMRFSAGDECPNVVHSYLSAVSGWWDAQVLL